MSNPLASNLPENLVCFSHLRWGFVFQRPQHLMSRFAKDHRVYFIEEPIRENCAEAEMNLRRCERTGVMVATPRLPADMTVGRATRAIARLTREMLNQN